MKQQTTCQHNQITKQAVLVLMYPTLYLPYCGHHVGSHDDCSPFPVIPLWPCTNYMFVNIFRAVKEADHSPSPSVAGGQEAALVSSVTPWSIQTSGETSAGVLFDFHLRPVSSSGSRQQIQTDLVAVAQVPAHVSRVTATPRYTTRDDFSCLTQGNVRWCHTRLHNMEMEKSK